MNLTGSVNIVILLKNKIRIFSFITTAFLFGITFSLNARTPVSKAISMESGKAIISENLEDGFELSDLSWGWSPEMQCFPASHKDAFIGNHKLYIVKLPPYSELSSHLNTPDKSQNRVSLYTYSLPEGVNGPLPPDVKVASNCQSRYDTYRLYNQNKTIVTKSLERPLTVVVGVAGGSLEYKSSFVLKLSISSQDNKISPPEQISVISLDRKDFQDKYLYQGDLNMGQIFPVKWGNKPEIACYPGMVNPMFAGNQILYRVKLKAYEEATITAIPELRETDLSLYSYKITPQVENPPLPPDVTTESCKASYGFSSGNPGVPETVKMRNGATESSLIISVASPERSTEGKYYLRILFKSTR